MGAKTASLFIKLSAIKGYTRIHSGHLQHIGAYDRAVHMALADVQPDDLVMHEGNLHHVTDVQTSRQTPYLTEVSMDRLTYHGHGGNFTRTPALLAGSHTETVPVVGHAPAGSEQLHSAALQHYPFGPWTSQHENKWVDAQDRRSRHEDHSLGAGY